MSHEYDYDPANYSFDNLKILLLKARAESIMHPLTAESKMSSANTVLIENNLLTESEIADLRTVNIEDVIRKFKETCTDDFTPNSLQTHCSHARTAVRFLIKFNQNPSAFPPDSYTPTAGRRPKESNNSTTIIQGNHTSQNNTKVSNNNLFTFDLQIPIRAGKHTVTITGLPKDIESKDINKISAVILACSEN